jgi:hypothetical protein
MWLAAAVLAVTASTAVVTAGTLGVMLLLHGFMMPVWRPSALHDDLAVCKCGRRIWGCQNWQGVPSTWMHVSDGRHLHDDGSWVEPR